MAMLLKQSTAVDVLIGPFVDLTDGYTSESGESPTVKLSKNGQALAAKSDVTTPVHDADGYYNCELDATDTGTLGTLVLTVAASANALPVRHEFMVVPANVWDALVGGSDTLNAAVTEWNGVALATTNPLPNAAPDAAGGLPVSDAGGLDLDAMNTNVSAILTDTAEIGAAGAGLTNINLPDQTMNITGNITGNLSGSVGSVTGNVGGNVTGSVGSLAAQAKADVNAEVDSALDTAVPGTPTAGSINDILKDLDALLPGSGTLSTLDAAAVNAQVVDALATDPYAEPGSVPAASVSLAAKIGWLYLLSRNKVTQTATQTVVRNDADSGNVATSTVSDDGTTFTRGEWS